MEPTLYGSPYHSFLLEEHTLIATLNYSDGMETVKMCCDQISDYVPTGSDILSLKAGRFNLPFVDKLVSYIANDALLLLLPLQSRLRPLNPLIVVEIFGRQ